MAGRIVPDSCVGVIIDFQEFFLEQVEKRARSRIRANTKSFARLLGYFRIPIVVTLERPTSRKGALPKDLGRLLNAPTEIFEKDFFDLTKEREIKDHLARLNKRQVIVCGCETDVCVLQSCLGLLGAGYEVYVMEELVFSSSPNVDAAIARMQGAGIPFLSYKTLYYELIDAVDGGRHAEKLFETFGPFPEDLSDVALQ